MALKIGEITQEVLPKVFVQGALSRPCFCVYYSHSYLLPMVKKSTFNVMEATIADIQKAITAKQITATDIVRMYLERIKAYNGVCVNQPEGILGRVSTIPNAGQINALMTLNLRPEHREAWGFDDRKARSMTDREDNDPPA